MELLQEWPPELTVEADGCQLFKVSAPEKGHRRRDVPVELTQLLKQGQNATRELSKAVSVAFRALFAWVLVAFGGFS